MGSLGRLVVRSVCKGFDGWRAFGSVYGCHVLDPTKMLCGTMYPDSGEQQLGFLLPRVVSSMGMGARMDGGYRGR